MKAGAQTTRQLPNAASQAKKAGKLHTATTSASMRTTSAKVHRDRNNFANRQSESASTRAISAEGSPRPRRIRAAPQRERFDAKDLRKRFAELKTLLQWRRASAIRRAQSPLRVHFHLAKMQMNESLRGPRNSQTLFMKTLRLPRMASAQNCARRKLHARAMEPSRHTNPGLHSAEGVVLKASLHAKLSLARLFATAIALGSDCPSVPDPTRRHAPRSGSAIKQRTLLSK